MPAFSIQVFLPDGDPEGLRVVTKSHWTGVAMMCPRVLYPNVSSRVEFHSTGVYLLLGRSEPDPLRRRIYVGEGDEVHTRIKKHADEKDFWTELIVFTKTDGSLNKADVRYLEAALVGLAKAAGRADVENATAPAPPVPHEAAKADLDSFLADMLVIYRLLGVESFESLDVPVDDEEAQLLSFELAGAKGIGIHTNEGMIVKAGSRARKAETATIGAGYHALRESLLTEQVLKEEGEHLVFTTDHLFSSPSAAGAVLYGGQVSGPQTWRDHTGKTLKQIEHEKLETHEPAVGPIPAD